MPDYSDTPQVTKPTTTEERRYPMRDEDACGSTYAAGGDTYSCSLVAGHEGWCGAKATVYPGLGVTWPRDVSSKPADKTTNLADGLPEDGQRGTCEHNVGLSVECFQCPPYGRTLVTGHLVRTRMHDLGVPALRVLIAYYSWMASDADEDTFAELGNAMHELRNRAGAKLDVEVNRG